VKDWATTIVILPLLLTTFALAEDFKTVSGQVYKDATVSHVEADGIELKTKSGIAKVYFSELPQDLQERFHVGVKEDEPRQPFFGRWAAATEDPAVLAKIIAVATVVISGVALVNAHIRSRRQPTRARRASRRKALRHAGR
jgi:hypothetical protein